jgi:hypothetical protein
MKRIFHEVSVALFGLSLLVSAFLGTSCTEAGIHTNDSGWTTRSSGLIPGLIRARRERDRGLLPESKWNEFGLWKKIKNEPATYIPAEYPKNSPRTDEDGQWFSDHRDGKRFFVPNYIEGPYSASVLSVEAAANVDWQYSKGKSWYRNVDVRE